MALGRLHRAPNPALSWLAPVAVTLGREALRDHPWRLPIGIVYLVHCRTPSRYTSSSTLAQGLTC